MSPEVDSARLDIWLWAARIYKTRTIAADACKNNRITINGQKGKPARQVRIGDRIAVDRGAGLIQELEVKGLIIKRVGPKLVPECLIDHTPSELYEQAAAIRQSNRIATPMREEGAGRPTKKERRDMDQLMDESEIDFEAFEKFARAMTRRNKR